VSLEGSRVSVLKTLDSLVSVAPERLGNRQSRSLKRSMEHDSNMYVTISEAAKLASVSRSTLYRFIESGKLTKTSKGIDVAELERVFRTLKTPSATSQDVQSSQSVDVLTKQIEFLQEQLRQAQDREKAAQAREDRLLDMLEQAQRLLTHQPSQTASESQGGRGPFSWFRQR
jgi:hypothetical protein